VPSMVRRRDVGKSLFEERPLIGISYRVFKMRREESLLVDGGDGISNV
jgi:hypothetical protein